MGVVHPFVLFEQAHRVYRQYRIEIDRAKDIGPPEQQEKEKPQVIFCIEQKAGIKNTAQPSLAERKILQGNRFPELSPYQQGIVARFCQAARNALHALVVAEIVGYGENDPGQGPVFNKYNPQKPAVWHPLLAPTAFGRNLKIRHLKWAVPAGGGMPVKFSTYYTQQIFCIPRSPPFYRMFAGT
jgi:hypothetical protein